MNLDDVLQTFIAESQELLLLMEDALLQIEQAPDDTDTINALFRVAHTIKGSAGLFGLTPIVAFTHVAESVLDRVRGNELRVDESLSALFLEVRDHLCTLIELLASHGDLHGMTAEHEQQGAALLEIADNMAARSIEFDSALQELATLLHRIVLAQTVPDAIAEDEPERSRLMELAQVFTPEDIQLYYQIAIHGRAEIDLAPDDYAGFTMTLLRMLAFSPSRSVGNASPTPVNAEPVSAIPKPPKQPLVSDPKSMPTQNKPEQATSEFLERSVLTREMSDWSVLFTQLDISGMGLQLAKHCVMQSFTDESITLCLPQENKHLQRSKMATIKLQEALSEYFSKKIKLNVVLGTTEVVTPAVIEQQDNDLRQQQANDAIAQDDFVREAQAELGASLIEESIKPLN
jgi:chemotaxis protein histidine kinase CheA